MAALLDLLPFGSRRVFFYTHPHGEITELYVEDEYRRLGVGRELLLLAEKIAKENDVEELFVLTGLSNQKALRLYRSTGYEDGDVVLSKELRMSNHRNKVKS